MRRLLLILLLVLGLGVISGLIWYVRNQTARELVGGFIGSPSDSLASTAGVTNVVFLGLGGEGHAAPDLTDSIIFVSLRHSDHAVRLISIPRDVWVPSLKAKINTAYHYGNEKRVGGGRDLAKSAVAEILGQPVHYALALDFAGFVQVIDAVGGIDVEVSRTFDDYKYPIPGQEAAEPEEARYEHLHFDQGLTHMDGTTALKFARSRNAEGEEGTDFARGLRQQQILTALQQKVVSTETLFDYDRLKGIEASVRSSLDTDISDGNFASFFKFFLSYSRAGQSAQSIDLTPYYLNPKNRSPYDGQWVLVPVTDLSTIHEYVAQTLGE